MRKVIRFLPILFLFLVSVMIIPISIVNSSREYVLVITINSGIYHGVEELVSEAIREAEKLDAPLIIILDTPGGVLSVVNDIVKDIRNSNVPVIGFVYPLGATAWSAGTILLMATHIAAMAPGTLIGAAQPVIYDPTTGSYRVVNESKIINPIVGIITELAKDRGRNITAAEKFVRENLYLDDEEALKYHVIEVVVRNLDELLDKIDGWTVELDTGRKYVLHTANAMIIKYTGSLRVHIVRFLSDPLINSLLATIGILMLIFGILSGHYPVIPLAIGIVLLTLLGSGFSTNIVSLLLITIGAIALAIEIFTPGFGILGFTGILLIALAIALLPMLNPGYLISPAYQAMLFWIGVSIGAGMGLFAGFIIYKVIKVRRQPLKIKTTIIGAIGKAIDNIPCGKTGFVFIDGEYWRAVGLEDISRGDKVLVVGKDGALLKVKKYVEEEKK